jgi:hypothetical protein
MAAYSVAAEGLMLAVVYGAVHYRLVLARQRRFGESDLRYARAAHDRHRKQSSRMKGLR